MPIISRPDGTSLNYSIDDFTDPWKDAPFLLLQHGFGRSSRLFYGWVPYLSRYYKVVRLDLRGCGLSSDISKAKPPRVQDYIDDILALLDEIGAQSVHYCGDSFGGILGTVLAATHPARVRTLTMLSSPVFIDKHNLKGVSAGHPTWEQALTEMGPKAWSEAMHKGVLMDRSTNPTLGDWFARDMAESRLDTLVEMATLAQTVNTTPYLSKVLAPVLGLYPTHGTLTSTEQEQLLRDNVSDLTYVRLPSPYHMAQHIAPAACATHVLYFASQFDGTSCHE
jgi:3-oxoadipate enol-lactonase